jgi:hypothetical protein
MGDRNELTDADYAALADFRYALRQFLVFSERDAASCGVTPQQHQALLAIRGATHANVSVGYVAERLETLGLVTRRPSPDDGRQALLELTQKAQILLRQLSKTHREEIVRLRPMLTELLARVD